MDIAAMVDHVRASIRAAKRRRSGLTPGALAIDGMSSPKVRHLLNNLCSMPGCRYLEVGSWKGSTLVSALLGNGVERAVAIDNFSEFGAPREEFAANCREHLDPGGHAFVDADCFSVDPLLLGGPFNVYLYDGAHDAGSQIRAFTHFDGALADPFVAVVDDWNVPRVRAGTREAFGRLGYSPAFEAELPARRNGDMRRWWNGLYVAAVRKGGGA